MPFDATETLSVQLHLQATLTVAEFLGRLLRLVPAIRAEVDGPGPAGEFWMDLALQDLAPGVEWRARTGFDIYGPGPILPERPNARLACPFEAAARLARMLRSWEAAGARPVIPAAAPPVFPARAAAAPARRRSPG